MPMPCYRCYFLDGNDHITGPPAILEADALGEALERATALLKNLPHHRGVEIWDGPKRLYPPVTEPTIPDRQSA